MKLIHQFPEGEVVMGMVLHKGRVYIATQRGIYVLHEDEIEPVEIKEV